MSNLDNIGSGGNVFDDPGLWTCRYDGIEFRDEMVYSMHMLMEHNENVGVGGVVPVNPVTPPPPTVIYQPPGTTTYPLPQPEPEPTPPPVVFTPAPTPVYTPSPVIPPAPSPAPVVANQAGFSVGALLMVVFGAMAIGRGLKSKRVKHG